MKSAPLHKPNFGFINPYPWMSAVEAMVHIELEKRYIPFSWRYFDGTAPMTQRMIPGFAPEFTLRDYKLVIVVLGNFIQAVPDILNNTALAAAALEYDGWKLKVLWESEVRADVGAAINREIPELVRPAITGPPRPNPYGNIDTVSRRVAHLKSASFGRSLHKQEPRNAVRSRRNGRTERRRPRGAVRSESAAQGQPG